MLYSLHHRLGYSTVSLPEILGSLSHIFLGETSEEVRIKFVCVKIYVIAFVGNSPKGMMDLSGEGFCKFLRAVSVGS